jgi:hypothetical protein
MSTMPYGPHTAAVRGFLVRLAGLGTADRDTVVARHRAIARSRAYEVADTLLGEIIARSGREVARDALSGPLLQLVKRRPSPDGSPATADDAASEIELEPIAEPALAALLALMVRDLLDAESLRLLTEAFSDTLPVS